METQPHEQRSSQTNEKLNCGANLATAFCTEYHRASEIETRPHHLQASETFTEDALQSEATLPTAYNLIILVHTKQPFSRMWL